MWRPLIAAMFSVCLLGGMASAQSAQQQQDGDPCVQARADWLAIQRAMQRSVLEAYRDSLPARCAVQRALAEERLALINATPTKPPPGRDTTRRTRVTFDCDNQERLRVLFDPAARRATLYRYARPSLPMIQTDSPQGFRYFSADGYEIEGEVNLTLSRNGGVITKCTPRRGG